MNVQISHPRELANVSDFIAVDDSLFRSGLSRKNGNREENERERELHCHRSGIYRKDFSASLYGIFCVIMAYVVDQHDRGLEISHQLMLKLTANGFFVDLCM